ncbi:hypothetical protein M0811_00391 [Anaeramoeba ignava]|uniref:Uncharacterized protein n=1 Tax=Anaeramoeba ignava TaxID=1746090 RepID=A0A9Q0LQW5_ANAIG|nr:hypothetical protein M0811_00391 [Anaeramoeba ignava]
MKDLIEQLFKWLGIDEKPDFYATELLKSTKQLHIPKIVPKKITFMLSEAGNFPLISKLYEKKLQERKELKKKSNNNNNNNNNNDNDNNAVIFGVFSLIIKNKNLLEKLENHLLQKLQYSENDSFENQKNKIEDIDYFRLSTSTDHKELQKELYSMQLKNEKKFQQKDDNLRKPIFPDWVSERPFLTGKHLFLNEPEAEPLELDVFPVEVQEILIIEDLLYCLIVNEEYFLN